MKFRFWGGSPLWRKSENENVSQDCKSSEAERERIMRAFRWLQIRARAGARAYYENVSLDCKSSEAQ